MIQALCVMLAVSVDRNPDAARSSQILELEPRVVTETAFRSETYTPADFRLGVWSVRRALRLTPGVVIDDAGLVWIEGNPLGDDSVMLDGMRILGTPRVFP